MKKQFNFLVIVLLISINAIAQSSGIFPGEPFNGMQVNYNITGATISKYTDTPGFTWTRSLVITKIQQGASLSISGTLNAGGNGCTVVVSVNAGGKPNSGTYEVKPGTPMSFKQEVIILNDARSASISINMEGHYSMGGGSRGVVVRSEWDATLGAVTQAAEPDKYKPAPSPVALLNNLLKNYMEKIPKGILANGNLNALADLNDHEKYGKYVCGGYQSTVLDFLEDLRKTKQMEGYDFGPIQAFGGGHQAVVVYPKGTDWKKTGTVLDPWINQKPEKYTVEEWTSHFPVGVRSSELYEGKYPMCGGSGYNNSPDVTNVPAPVINWYKTLSKDRQAYYEQIRAKDVKVWARQLKNDFPDRNNDIKVIADCPVSLYVTDASGRISGFPDGKYSAEIPEVSVMTLKLADGTYWTELAYPRNRNLRITLQGTANGSVKLYAGLNMQEVQAKRSIYKYSFPVTGGEKFSFSPNEANAPGSILALSKDKAISGAKITSVNDAPDAKMIPGKEEKIFDNGNIYGVANGPTGSTPFKLSKSTYITRIENYHYFNNGKRPGTITLMNSEGKQVGSWQATGSDGQGGVQNAYWVVKPNMNLPQGTYFVTDSDPSTWSMNAQSANKGFITVWAANPIGGREE